jgi:hypothetical protein
LVLLHGRDALVWARLTKQIDTRKQ